MTADILESENKPHCHQQELQTLAEQLLAGELDSRWLSHWSLYYWNRGDFCLGVHPEGLLSTCETGASTPRYGGSTSVAHGVMYGAAGEAGCVMIHAPPEGDRFRGDFKDLHVPLHSHSSDHIAMVMDGGGTFLVKRQWRGEDVILMANVEPGAILFYPAGTPHTFISGKNGIKVASAQAEFELPTSTRFASGAPEYLNHLPRVEYSSYLNDLAL